MSEKLEAIIATCLAVPWFGLLIYGGIRDHIIPKIKELMENYRTKKAESEKNSYVLRNK